MASDQRFTLGQTFRVCLTHEWAGYGDCPYVIPPHPLPGPPLYVQDVDHETGVVTIGSKKPR